MSTLKIHLSGQAALLAVSLFMLTMRFGPAQLVHAQTTWPTRYFAPYSFDPSNQTDLVTLSQKTGTKFFTLAFIINGNGRACQASWNAAKPIGTWMQSSISALRAAGGDISVSFGGNSGTEIADSCTTVSSLEAQYQSVITSYNLTHLDFDIEGYTLSNTGGSDLRNKAIAALQAQAATAGRQLVISYTLPVTITGLTPAGISLLQDAIQDGVNVGVVNIMTMDYDSEDAPPDQMGQNAIDAANSLFDQLQSLYPSKTASQLGAMIGLTPMIGVNDDGEEVFTLQDAQTVLSFAEQQNITLLSFWNIQRDHQCVQDESAPNDCSGVTQQLYQYDQTFAPFTSTM